MQLLSHNPPPPPRKAQNDEQAFLLLVTCANSPIYMYSFIIQTKDIKTYFLQLKICLELHPKFVPSGFVNQKLHIWAMISPIVLAVTQLRSNHLNPL
jgi:hypothetical protein